MITMKGLINIAVIVLLSVIALLDLSTNIKYASIFLKILMQTIMNNPSKRSEHKFFKLIYVELGVFFAINSIEIVLRPNYEILDKSLLLIFNILIYNIFCVVITYYSYKVLLWKRIIKDRAMPDENGEKYEKWH